MSDIRQFTPVFFLQLSRIARQGLSLCTAKIVFFPEVSLSVVDLVVYLCQNCAAGGMGASPHTFLLYPSAAADDMQWGNIGGCGRRQKTR